jgi:small-conductance mechanosensitive channel
VWLLRSRHLDPVLAVLPVPVFLKSKGFLRTLRTAVFLVFAFVVVSGLLGFKFLSDYVAQGASFTLAVLALAWILGEGALACLRLTVHPEMGALARKYPGREQFFSNSYQIITRVVSILLTGVAVLVALAVWKIDFQRLTWAFQWLGWGPSLGPIRLSPLNLGLTVLVVYLGFWVSRLLRTFLDLKFYPSTDWDPGIQYTVSMTTHYVILFITILLAMNTMGVSITSLALVAGGLGVGIGFGLQNIVSNFLSGLILLFERPIKVGDMLVIDGQWGMVKEIRVRSTIFQTFDRYFLIIPNSDLISGKILNWTYAGWGINRLTLKVGVSYVSDPRKVTHIIEEVCRANPRVIGEPPPQIFFEAYGDSSLNFNIWVHLGTPSDRIPATHELNSAIFEAFAAQGIEIPFPQRDLHVRSWSPEAPRPLSLSTSQE